jgi:hypothetical protein
MLLYSEYARYAYFVSLYLLCGWDWAHIYYNFSCTDSLELSLIFDILSDNS